MKETIPTTTIEGLYRQSSQIIEQARSTAYRQINEALVRRNWALGKLIYEEELKGNDRALYGAEIIKVLSKRLTNAYGKGFSKSSLYAYRLFYTTHPNIFQSVIGKSDFLLSWTHYFVLNQELNGDARAWYEHEAAQQGWSVRTLQRNISSQYYYRLLASQRKDLVEKEMVQLTAPFQTNDPTEFIKNPVIGQFLRMYDELKRTEGDNPTIGLLLCDDTDEDIARYSVLHDNDHLFASKYMTIMPTSEQLRAEIERQKAIYYLQLNEKGSDL